ncbi:hypothetical protein NGF69_16680 [Enterococcus casseliflavus]|nr:hypothetical protein [Enterococcus casseliflavus]
MSEINQLVKFMRSGKRKKIRLSEYMALQAQKGLWNKERAINLRREISLTDLLNVSYVQKREGQYLHTETVLSLKNKRKRKNCIMKKSETYYPIKKKYFNVIIAGHVGQHIEVGHPFIGIPYRFFTTGVDFKALRAAKGIEIVETGHRYEILRVFKSRKYVGLFLKNPESLKYV